VSYITDTNWIQSHQAYQARIIQRRSWNSLLIQLYKISKCKPSEPHCGLEVRRLIKLAAYSELILITNFANAIKYLPLSSANADAIRLSFDLYALHTIDSDAGSFSTSGAIGAVSLDHLSESILAINGSSSTTRRKTRR
jgi:acyl-CoA oxidase